MAEKKPRNVSRRLQLACEPCKVAKLKCDRALPTCNQCYKRLRESTCKYTEKGLRYNVSSQTSDSMKRKLERLETLVNNLKNCKSEREHDASLLASIALNTSSQEEHLPSQTGKFKLAKSGSTEWIGPSNWESVIEDISEIRAFFELEESRPILEMRQSRTNISDSIPMVNPFLGIAPVFTETDLLDHLPPRSELDRYVAAWFNVMDPTRVIVHAPTFQYEYERFWKDPKAVEPTWFSLLLATTSLGAEICGQGLRDDTILTQADLLRRLTLHALVLAEPTKPQPWLIESLILYIAGLLFQHHDTTSNIWHLMGMTIRLCHQAGYHRDPSTNPALSQFTCEMRRRVWMIACELDISISNTLGMVSFVNPKLCGTLPPANLTESDLSPGHCAQPRPHEDCTLVQVEICFARIVHILGEVVVSSHAIVPPSRAEVDRMSGQLDNAKSQLPEGLKMKPLDQSFIDSPTEIVDRLRLELAYQKALCVLYRRFLGQAGFEQEGTRCIDAAQAIVSHSNSMLLATKPGGQLASVWVLLVRHIHDFTLAAMLICSPSNKLCPDNRLKLLQVCQLWNSAELQSAKARTALKVIMRYLQAGQNKDQTSSTSTREDSSAGTTVPVTTGMETDNSLFDVDMLYDTPQALPDMQYEDYETILDSIFAPTDDHVGVMGAWF